MWYHKLFFFHFISAALFLVGEKGYICKAALFSLSCLREESKTSFDGIFQKYFHLFFTHTLLSRPFLFRLFGFFVPYIMFCFFVCILCAWHNLILDRGVSTCDFILSASISTSYQCFLNIQTLWQVLVFLDWYYILNIFGLAIKIEFDVVSLIDW